MTKFSVTKNGKPLKSSLFTWDEKTKTFSSKEDGLVLDFKGNNGVTFRTNNCCEFITGGDCTFRAGQNCTFNTGGSCTFMTGVNCTFTTGDCCVFNTGSKCVFFTGSDCTFKAGVECIFKTGHNCFITRLDIAGITEVPLGKTIKLNGYVIAGYTLVEEKKEASCAGKVVEIDGKKYKLVEA